MNGLKRNQISKRYSQTAFYVCATLISCLSFSVLAEQLVFNNPYSSLEYLDGEKKIDSFCGVSPDHVCLDSYLDMIAIRHLNSNFEYYKASLKQFTYHMYAGCLNKESSGSIEKRHVKYSNHIKSYARQIFTWGVAQYFYKHKKWPNTNSFVFDSTDFSGWIKNTPRELDFICSVLKR
jgi:hypothetical protein